MARSKRSIYFPEIPTLIESGADIDLELVQGIYAPAGIPRSAVTRLNKEIGRIVQGPEVRNVVASIGGEAVVASAEEFGARQRRDRERFGVFIRKAISSSRSDARRRGRRLRASIQRPATLRARGRLA